MGEAGKVRVHQKLVDQNKSLTSSCEALLRMDKTEISRAPVAAGVDNEGKLIEKSVEGCYLFIATVAVLL